MGRVNGEQNKRKSSKLCYRSSICSATKRAVLCRNLNFGRGDWHFLLMFAFLRLLRERWSLELSLQHCSLREIGCRCQLLWDVSTEWSLKYKEYKQFLSTKSAKTAEILLGQYSLRAVICQLNQIDERGLREAMKTHKRKNRYYIAFSRHN